MQLRPRGERNQPPPPVQEPAENDMMQQIRQGMQLRPRGERNQPPPPVQEPAGDDLLAQIRNGVQLRPSPARNQNIAQAIPANIQRDDLRLNGEEERIYNSLTVDQLRERCRELGATPENLAEGDGRPLRNGRKPYFFELYRRLNPGFRHIPNPNFNVNYPEGDGASDNDDDDEDWE